MEIDAGLGGRGTTMRMVFPAFVDQGAADGNAHAARKSSRRLRILVIDDDPILIRSMRDVLEADGHHIDTALGGQAGIDAFVAARGTEHEFAVVITDLGMPRIDGRRVAAAIKQVAPSTPIVLLTGWGQRLLDEKEVPPNIDRVLSKPPRLHQLRTALLELVG